MNQAVPSPEEAVALKAAVHRIDEMRAEVAVRRGMILAGPPREPQIITQADLVAELIRSGALIPITVFGGPCECGACDGGLETAEAFSYGLMDRISAHAPGGSDCNRADAYMLRPGNDLLGVPAVKAALRAALEDEDARLA